MIKKATAKDGMYDGRIYPLFKERSAGKLVSVKEQRELSLEKIEKPDKFLEEVDSV